MRCQESNHRAWGLEPRCTRPAILWLISRRKVLGNYRKLAVTTQREFCSSTAVVMSSFCFAQHSRADRKTVRCLTQGHGCLPAGICPHSLRRYPLRCRLERPDGFEPSLPPKHSSCSGRSSGLSYGRISLLFQAYILYHKFIFLSTLNGISRALNDYIKQGNSFKIERSAQAVLALLQSGSCALFLGFSRPRKRSRHLLSRPWPRFAYIRHFVLRFPNRPALR